MNINDFLKLPIVKITITILFIYYVYNKTKDNPRSISYHINKENFGKAGEIVKYGAGKLYRDGSLISEEADNQDSANREQPKINVRDIAIGYGTKSISCGSEVEIEYSLIDKSNDSLANKSSIKFFVGEGFNRLIEKAIIDMREGGIRIVDIPRDFKTGDSQYDNLILSNPMIYQINILSIGDNKKEGLTCV